MKILVLNCGSSSLKYQLIDMQDEKAMAKGLCERIGIKNSKFEYKRFDGAKIKKEIDMKNHEDAVKVVMSSYPRRRSTASIAFPAASDVWSSCSEKDS